MSEEPLNQETQEVMRKGQMISEFVKSESWAFVKDLINEQIDSIGDIRSIDIDKIGDKDRLVDNVLGRQTAIKALQDVIADIENFAYQFQNNFERTVEVTEVSYIKRFN